MVLIAVPKQRVPSWEIDLFEATTLALDQDYLKGEMLRHRLLLRASGVDMDGAGSTYTGRITLEDRTLRSAVQNALGIRTVLYSDNMNRRIVHSVFSSVSPLMTWVSNHQRVCRGIDKCADWRQSQSAGEFQAHVNEIMSTLVGPVVLATADFILDDTQLGQMCADDIEMEDEL